MGIWNRIFGRTDKQEVEETSSPEASTPLVELEAQLTSDANESGEETPIDFEKDNNKVHSEEDKSAEVDVEEKDDAPINEEEKPSPEDSVEKAKEKKEIVESESEENRFLEIEPKVSEQKQFSEDVIELVEDPESDYLEDLTKVEGLELPQLKVPTWQEELDLVKERYEPCDLSEHIVKVSKRRLTARRIDFELAKSRLTAYERYMERASRRFKDRVDENNLLRKSLEDIHQWRAQQARSVAWRLADRVNEEVQKAKTAEEEATSFVEANNTYSNPGAVVAYRYFARRVFLIPVVTLYIGSVAALTYFKFEWILKFFPFFNLGIKPALIMISGVGSGFFIRNLWRYGKVVSRVQKDFIAFNNKYKDQYNKIRHAVKEHTRLAQQQPGVEPRLRVLAKAYRVQLQADVSIKAQATTFFDPETLPACVTLARAVVEDEITISKLRMQALRVLMAPGWRTNGLEDIARIHAESKMLDSHSISLRSLDTDSILSANNAQKVLLEAFSNKEIHGRVSKSRLIRAIKDLHREVLANWDSKDRPEVTSLRNDGFDKSAFRSTWLEDEDLNENWIEFLTEILSEETSPFGTYNINDKRSDLNDERNIQSVAVVPSYFNTVRSRIKIEKSPVKEITPLDVVVRVDVSPWADPSAFSVFAESGTSHSANQILEDTDMVEGRTTSA